MVRQIDAEHLKSRIMEPKDEVEKTFVDGLIKFIDEEPTYKNEIQWIKHTISKKTKTCNASNNGVRCSRCGHFQLFETAYCQDCGGHYYGTPVLTDHIRLFND